MGMAFEIEQGISRTIEQMANNYDNMMVIAIYQKLKDIGEKLMRTYETSDGNAPSSELERRAELHHIGSLLCRVEAEGEFNQTSETVNALKELYSMGVRLKITTRDINKEFDPLSKTFKFTQEAPLIEVQLVKDIAKL